jgi:hypothetical protein
VLMLVMVEPHFSDPAECRGGWQRLVLRTGHRPGGTSL